MEPHGLWTHETVQVTPWFAGSFATIAVNGAVAPAWTVASVGESDTVTARTVICADAATVLSARDVARMVTVRSLDGGVAGAV